MKKFSDPYITAKGDTRASVRLKNLETLWFNTGTLCNLSCENCYIESSPKNDRLVYLNSEDVISYLVEIKEQDLKTKEIAFTGGEPFMNPHMISIIEDVLSRGFECLVLTNAYKALNKIKVQSLIELNRKYPDKLLIRVSLDHYTKEIHEKERGPKTFDDTLKNMKFMFDQGLPLAVAGRGLTGEDIEKERQGYLDLLEQWQMPIDVSNPRLFMVFPEMIPNEDVPEITTECWSILNKSPDSIMCASSRMIVKRKGEDKTKVLSCTLLAYDKQFELGETLKDSQKDVYLNHAYCAKFCVLGGASCSG